jgi:hypothetical protein
MKPDLVIDTGPVRGAATFADRLAARVAAGTAHAPALLAVPRWATTDAEADAVDAARRHLTRVGDDLREAARQLAVTVLDYEDADARAAARLRRAA